MRRLALIPALLCASLLTAEEPAPMPATAPAADADSQLIKDAGYVLGMDVAQKVGGTIEEFGLSLDDVLAGIKDGSSGAKPRLSPEQAQDVMKRFMERHRAQAAELAAKDAAEAPKRKETNAAWLADNGKKPGIITTKSGLQYEVLASGQGASPKLGDSVVCSYSGRLLSGKVFDASERHGGPATFTVGQVIPGWNEALQMMKEGDKWRLFIPSDLAYGEAGSPPAIGPSSLLVCEVELHKVNAAGAPATP
jgi:FKBP-type peptidyl-prolyl cis-trans isomerase